MKENQTICQFLGITVSPGDPFTIKDDKGNEIYKEYHTGEWIRYEFDANRNITFCVDDEGFWSKTEFDENRNQVYFENSKGFIRDHRPKPKVTLTLQQIADKFGIDIEQLSILK